MTVSDAKFCDEGFAHPASKIAKLIRSPEHTRGIGGMRIDCLVVDWRFEATRLGGEKGRLRARMVERVLGTRGSYGPIVWCPVSLLSTDFHNAAITLNGHYGSFKQLI